MTAPSVHVHGKERRRHPRIAVGLAVWIRKDKAAKAGNFTAVNVSASGMLVNPAIPSNAGRTCLVSVDGFAETLAARIVSHRSQGTGITFEDINQGETLALWMVERAIRSP
ncbi:MAG: PilZ domain-containing protein [Minwuia sp.]|nr:PilZ domain-containing protein [Minwuia sp.]